VPLINFLFGKAQSFNITLYISIVTGVVFLLYVVSLENDLFIKFLNGSLTACILFSIWGEYEVVTGHYILSNNVVFTEGLNWNNTHYPIAAFPNTNDIAQFLVMLFPISSYSLLKKNKVVWAIATILVFGVIYASASRLCMMAFVIIWFITLSIKLLLENRAKSFIKLLMTVFAICICLSILEAETGLVTSVIINFMKVDSNAAYYGARSDIYSTVFNTALKLPFGGFGSAYEVYVMPPHNLFLYILCDYGWIPALLFVSLLIMLAVIFFKQMRRAPHDLQYYLLFSSLCMFPVLSCVSSTNEQRKIIWMILGIMINRYYYLKSRKHIVDNKRQDDGRVYEHTICVREFG